MKLVKIFPIRMDNLVQIQFVIPIKENVKLQITFSNFTYIQFRVCLDIAYFAKN